MSPARTLQRTVLAALLWLAMAHLSRGQWSAALDKQEPATAMKSLNQYQALKISTSNLEDDSSSMGSNGLVPPGDRTSAGGNISAPASPLASQQANNAQALRAPPSVAAGGPQGGLECPNGLLTFELLTGFIYKPASAETLAMLPSTLQLTDCLNSCLQNGTCLAINFEMGLCVLLSSSAQQNPTSLYSSQFPVFTIYAEKKCLLASGEGKISAARINKRRQCQRAWSFERVAGYEMRTKPRRRLKLANKELCMEACLTAADFECRSANWYRQSGECALNEQDRHSVSQAEASDQRIKPLELYGPSNLSQQQQVKSSLLQLGRPPTPPPGLYQNYFAAGAGLSERSPEPAAIGKQATSAKYKTVRQLLSQIERLRQSSGGSANQVTGQYSLLVEANETANGSQDAGHLGPLQYALDLPANALVDYLENNCVQEPNKLCEFRKIQNKILKTVDSIYQDVASLEECKQKCLSVPYRCYSFDYGDTSERVCRTSHLDQASLMSIKDPYLEVVGAITYELAACFNVSIQCRAREMVAQVSSSKMFKGKIYVKSRPNSCQNDVRESLHFELAMKYHEDSCDVRSGSNQDRGIFSNDIVIQHHDRILTTQDVGLSVYCQYDLGNRSVTNNVDLAIERIEEPQAAMSASSDARYNSTSGARPSNSLSITSLATTVVRSPNVTMRITNMNGQPVSSATVGDRLALLFEIKEKTSPFGIFVREIIAMDGKQVAKANGNSTGADLFEPAYLASRANSVMFIDSQGCPTDANIMGPLQRMDPTGQRILAPFDAFKFPTSDMVFFRAVVSSCVSECKPVECGPAPTTLTAADFELSSAPSQQPTGGPPAPQQQQQQQVSQLVASTRNMQPARSTEPLSSGPALSGATLAMQSTTASHAPDLSSGPIDASASTPAPAPAPAPAPGSAPASLDAAADTLTTVAGFDQPDQKQRPDETSATNLSNNHQGGKVPPRPNLQQNTTMSARPDLPAAPLDLSLLTSQQKQQLVKLFEQRLRSPSSSLNSDDTGSSSGSSDVKALTSFMLNAPADSNAIVSSRSASASASAPDKADVETGKENENEYRKRAAQPISGTKSAQVAEHKQLEDKLENYIDLFLTSRLDELRPADQAEDDQSAPARSSAATLPGKADANTQSKPKPKPKPKPRPDKQASNYSELGSPVNSSGSQRNAAPRQHFDRASEPLGDLSSIGGNQDNAARGAASMDAFSPELRQLADNNNGNQAGADTSDGQPTSGNKVFSWYGRRRRRSIPSAPDKSHGAGGHLSDGLVVRQVVSQEQHYLNPLDGRELPFREALVEMYHTGARPERSKREANELVEEQPQVEELVVQAIRIVDRLHFADEGAAEAHRQTTAIPVPRKLKSSGKGSKPAQAPPQQQQRSNETLGLRDLADQMDDEEPISDRSVKWSALGLIMMGTLFVFAQASLVLICLLDWTSSGRPGGRRARAQTVADWSTMSSRCASVLSTDSRGCPRHWPEDSARLSGVPVRNQQKTTARAMSSSPSSWPTGEALMMPGSHSGLDSHLLHYNKATSVPSPSADIDSYAIYGPANSSRNKLLFPLSMPKRNNCWSRFDHELGAKRIR